MAKVTAPMMSFSASGSLAKTLVASKWRGIPYMRQHVVPANPQTTAQQLNRTTFSTLREMWKVAPELVWAPWNAFATGRKFLGLNAYIGENLRVVGGESDMQNWIGCPGAGGGLSAVSITAATGAAEGEIDVTFVNPDAPTDWTLVAAVAAAFPDQEPSIGFGGPLVAAEDTATMDSVTLEGLGSGTLCVVAGWLQWTKPNGQTAYGVGITTTATSGTA